MTSRTTNSNTKTSKSNTKSKPNTGSATARAGKATNSARKTTNSARSRTSAAAKTGTKVGQKVTAKADVKGTAQRAGGATAKTAQRAGGATAKAVKQPVAKVAGMLPGNLGRLLILVVTMITRWPAAIIGGVVAAIAVLLGFVLRRNR